MSYVSLQVITQIDIINYTKKYDYIVLYTLFYVYTRQSLIVYRGLCYIYIHIGIISVAPDV